MTKMLNVRLIAGGKKGVLGKWDLDKPVIRFKPDIEYAVTEEAFNTQPGIFEKIEDTPPPPPTPAPAISEVLPSASETPEPVVAPPTALSATEAKENTKEPLLAKTATKRYGGKKE